MATYNYQTRQIEIDFHFVEWDTKCKGSGLPCKAGSERCVKCQYFAGSIHPWSFRVEHYGRLEESYVKCKHPEAKDSEGCATARHLFCEALEDAALCALCY